MRFLIKVDGQEREGTYSSTQDAFDSTAASEPEARSIVIFCLRGEK